MSSALHHLHTLIRSPPVQSNPLRTYTYPVSRNEPTIYSRIEAHDSSSVHAGDRYTTYNGNYHNHITTSGPVFLIDREILQHPPENILSLVEELQSTTLLLEELQHQVRALETSSGQAIGRRDNSYSLAAHKVQKARRTRGARAKLPRGASLHTSIRYIASPSSSHQTNGAVLTLKIRFTITYDPISVTGAVNHWYEWHVDVVNPSHKRLLSSSSTGIGLANIARGNRFFPSCELFITLKEGWTWDGDESDDEIVTGFSCHDTRQEILDCIVGTQTVEKEFKVKPCSCFLCDWT